MMAAINLLYGLPLGDHNVPLIWCRLPGVGIPHSPSIYREFATNAGRGWNSYTISMASAERGYSLIPRWPAVT